MPARCPVNFEDGKPDRFWSTCKLASERHRHVMPARLGMHPLRWAAGLERCLRLKPQVGQMCPQVAAVLLCSAVQHHYFEYAKIAWETSLEFQLPGNRCAEWNGVEPSCRVVAANPGIRLSLSHKLPSPCWFVLLKSSFSMSACEVLTCESCDTCSDVMVWCMTP
jgi:hypothetical protein